MIRQMTVLAPALILVATLITACGSGGGDNGGPQGEETPAGIGPTGGTVASSDGKASVRIPAGALAQATVVTVTPATNPPSGHLGTAYEFGPSGTTFAQPVTISIIYDETTLPVGTTALNLQLATVVNQQWQGVAGSSVDQAAKTVSGSTPSFSTYGIIAVSRPDLVLPAPTWVAAVAGDGSVTVSWDPVPGATLYHVYIASQSGVTKEKYEDTRGGVTSSFEWTGLTNGTIYYVVVTAVNAGGESGESREVFATPSAPPAPAPAEPPAPVEPPEPAPPAPLGVVAIAGDGSVTVSWDPVPGATAYHVYIASQSGVTKENYGSLPNGDTRGGVTSSFAWTGLTNGTIYYVVVTAVNAYGESGESLEVAAAPSGGEPPPPQPLPLPPPLLPPPSTAV